jgi:predicted amidophosphoribosyltransferase
MIDTKYCPVCKSHVEWFAGISCPACRKPVVEPTESEKEIGRLTMSLTRQGYSFDDARRIAYETVGAAVKEAAEDKDNFRI